MHEMQWVQRCYAMRNTWEREHSTTSVEHVTMNSTSHVHVTNWNDAMDLRNKLRYTTRRRSRGYRYRRYNRYNDIDYRERDSEERYASIERKYSHNSRRDVQPELQTAKKKIMTEDCNIDVNNVCQQAVQNRQRTALKNETTKHDTLSHGVIKNEGNRCRNNNTQRNENSQRTTVNNKPTKYDPLPHVIIKKRADTCRDNNKSGIESNQKTAFKDDKTKHDPLPHVIIKNRSESTRNNNTSRTENRLRTAFRTDPLSHGGIAKNRADYRCCNNNISKSGNNCRTDFNEHTEYDPMPHVIIKKEADRCRNSNVVATQNRHRTALNITQHRHDPLPHVIIKNRAEKNRNNNIAVTEKRYETDFNNVQRECNPIPSISIQNQTKKCEIPTKEIMQNISHETVFNSKQQVQPPSGSRNITSIVTEKCIVKHIGASVNSSRATIYNAQQAQTKNICQNNNMTRGIDSQTTESNNEQLRRDPISLIAVKNQAEKHEIHVARTENSCRTASDNVQHEDKNKCLETIQHSCRGYSPGEAARNNAYDSLSRANRKVRNLLISLRKMNSYRHHKMQSQSTSPHELYKLWYNCDVAHQRYQKARMEQKQLKTAQNKTSVFSRISLNNTVYKNQVNVKNNLITNTNIKDAQNSKIQSNKCREKSSDSNNTLSNTINTCITVSNKEHALDNTRIQADKSEEKVSLNNNVPLNTVNSHKTVFNKEQHAQIQTIQGSISQEKTVSNNNNSPLSTMKSHKKTSNIEHAQTHRIQSNDKHQEKSVVVKSHSTVFYNELAPVHTIQGKRTLAKSETHNYDPSKCTMGSHKTAVNDNEQHAQKYRKIHMKETNTKQQQIVHKNALENRPKTAAISGQFKDSQYSNKHIVEWGEADFVLMPSSDEEDSPKTAINNEQPDSEDSQCSSNFWGEASGFSSSFYVRQQKIPQTASDSKQSEDRQDLHKHSGVLDEANCVSRPSSVEENSHRTAFNNAQSDSEDSQYSIRQSNFWGKTSAVSKSFDARQSSSKLVLHSEQSEDSKQMTKHERERQREFVETIMISDTSDDEDNNEINLGTDYDDVADLAEVEILSMHDGRPDKIAKANLSLVGDGEQVDWQHPDFNLKDRFTKMGVCRTKLLLDVLHELPDCYHHRDESKWTSRNSMTPPALHRVMQKLNLWNKATEQYKWIFNHLKKFSGTHLFIKHALDHGGFPEALQCLEDEARHMRQYQGKNNPEITTCPDWHKEDKEQTTDHIL